MKRQAAKSRIARAASERLLKHCAQAVIVTLACTGAASAEDKAAAVDAPAKPTGLLPVPDYSGDLGSRSHLTGDWGGTRNGLAQKGVQLDIDFTQYVQGVTSGGRESASRFGGSLDYLLNLDFMQMGLMPGALLTLRAETRYGEAANDIAGALLPVNTEGLFPTTSQLDDNVAFALTTLRYAQFFCEQFGVVVGKFDTLESTNEFIGGRGVNQFMNGNFVIPPAGALSVPYSTLGAGVVIMPIKDLTITSMIMNTKDSSTTAGFDNIGDGWTSVTSAQYQYKLGSLPGGQGVSFGYAADSDFKTIEGGLVFTPGEGLSLAKSTETWFVSWDTWQYVWVKDAAEKSINLSNGTQDLAGVGLFSRLVFADKDTNPIDFSLAVGVGAKGLIPTREHDTFGVAYAYNHLQSGRLSGFLNLESQSQAFETYYNLAITPATHLTFDLQVVDSAQSSIDTAVVLGARLNVRF